MRILPWSLGTSSGLSRALPLCAALGLALSTSPASAQPKPADKPAAPAPKKPKKPQPAAAQPAAPPTAGDDTAAQPPASGDPATGAAAPQTPGVAGEPEAAQPKPAAEPLIPPSAPAKPAGSPAGGEVTERATGTGAVAPDPDRDAKALEKQGNERPTATKDPAAPTSEVFAEDWWSHARPTFEFHGYYRLRAELFHTFDLGRRDAPENQLWPHPIDDYYNVLGGGPQGPDLCGNSPLGREPCEEHTQAGANMRFRLSPELHISDNLRVFSQIDLLDNLVLGSTPEGYANKPGVDDYALVKPGGYTPLGAFASTQWAPSAGITSPQDSIVVKRVWGEYTTPLGVLRFGRMPNHWGLGILANSGDGHDSDWQSTADRIMFMSGFKDLDLYFAGAWDFASEGPISASLNERQGQPYDLGQLDDVSQYVFVAVRKRSPELQKRDLALGNVVLNGGLYFTFRNQVLANDDTTNQATAGTYGQEPGNISQGLVRRGAEAYIPDLWFQFLYKKFRFEMEAALILGSIESTQSEPGSNNYNNQIDPKDPGWDIRQFGLAAEMDYRAVEDRLRLGLGFGYSTGDDDLDSLAPRSKQPLQLGADRTISTFRFHPDYRVDMIFYRNILSRVQGSYYFRPSVDYDFRRDKNGQKIGGGAALIWSRASEFVQTPGHKRDLGIELNGSIYYQSKDGTLNDDPGKMGGFFTSLQYGVFFPLGGLGYLPDQVERAGGATSGLDTSTAQTLRWYMGVMF
ncbi:MAG TPA: TIGR04551 family protein [Polyangiaceae bacterium]|nr:TIGR04551 family protein [Polyangiaceae bacterium]